MLVSMVYLRWAMSRVLRVAKLATVLALLVFLYISLLIPGIVATTVMAALLLGLIVVEQKWPALASRGAELARSDG
jgi:hypothetical protein